MVNVTVNVMVNVMMTMVVTMLNQAYLVRLQVPSTGSHKSSTKHPECGSAECKILGMGVRSSMQRVVEVSRIPTVQWL